MQTIPLHPAIVHVPVALAVLAPFLALYLVVSFRGYRELSGACEGTPSATTVSALAETDGRG